MKVENLDEGNVDDVFKICSHGMLDDPIQQRGIELKRRWLLEMLKRYGPCTKIAYIDGRPVAQILFYPEEAIPSFTHQRRGIVLIHCAYNPFPEAQGKGAGTALIESLIYDCKTGIPCPGGGHCRFITARPFNTGVGTPLAEFYA